MNLKLYASDYFYDPKFQIKVIERNPELPYPLHSHDFYELVVIVSGSGVHFTRQNEFTLMPGNIFVITPGMEHGYKDVHQLCLYNIMFNGDLLRDSLHDLTNMPGYHALFSLEPTYRDDAEHASLMCLKAAQMADILPIIEQMLKECDSIETETGAKGMTFSLLIQLMVIIFRIYADFPRKDNQMILRLADAFSFLETHTNRPVTTKELMEVTNMSSSTLNRYFQSATGCSPIEFHTQRRIAQACRLIRSSILSMGEVAEATGFSDPNYFSRQFRQVMGMSPMQYKSNRSLWYS